MLQHETKIRVCYGDTDKLGVVYYGTYPRYYEIARTELLRHYGITYKEIEDKGVVWPVRSLHITYLKPAFYDDLLTVRTIVEELPLVRFKIKTEIYNSQDELINHGEVVLISTNPLTGKAMKTPRWLIEKLSLFILPSLNPLPE
jgi:acyl-CoA thioester hydrolase